jgi:K+-sensing histidine kinase KdpD
VARAPAAVRLGATNGQRRNPREATFGSRWHRGRFSVEIVLALAADVAFVLAATVCATARDHVPAVLLGSLLLLVVLAVARFGGILYALPVGVMTMQAFDWYFLRPLRELGAATVLVDGPRSRVLGNPVIRRTGADFYVCPTDLAPGGVAG